MKTKLIWFNNGALYAGYISEIMHVKDNTDQKKNQPLQMKQFDIKRKTVELFS